MLYLAWKHGGADPYRTFNGARAPDPAWPSRVRNFIYACAELAQEEEAERTQAMIGRGVR